MWFPDPGSWLKASGLAVAAWFGCTAAFSLCGWHFLFLAFLAAMVDVRLASFLAAYSSALLAASLIWYLVVILLYRLLLKMLWERVPKALGWLDPPRSWRSLMLGWIVCTIATLGAMPFFEIAYYYNRQLMQAIGYEALFTKELIWKVFLSWWVLAAYLYQLSHLLEKTHKRDRS